MSHFPTGPFRQRCTNAWTWGPLIPVKELLFRDKKVVSIVAILLLTLISIYNWRKTITKEGTFSAQQLALFGNTLYLHQSSQQTVVYCSQIISPTLSLFSFQFPILFPFTPHVNNLLSPPPSEATGFQFALGFVTPGITFVQIFENWEHYHISKCITVHL